MSTTPAQVANVVRYHLGELKSRNAHHDFEHLCRNLTRLRIYSNVIPATGPVGAGGDGGRDFETFSTTISRPVTSSSTFAEHSTGARKVAFACSLETKIEAKIRSDVAAILAGGQVDEIVYFCEANLAVSKRHAIQQWAKAKSPVELQIFDGQAISELLSDRDTFWIAQEYLRIPAELMPSSADDADWYVQALKRWADREPVRVSRSDFMEIKRALRRATFQLDARPQLLFWIKRMEDFLYEDTPRGLYRAALYEVAVATLRGKGDLTSEIERIRDYFHDLEQFTGVADLQDAATLTMYASGAWALGQFQIDPKEVFTWRQRIEDCLDGQITSGPGPARRSGLLQVRGNLCALPLEPGGVSRLDETFDHWNLMLDDAERSPQFPIESFADHLAKITVNLGQHPRFPAMTDRVDALLAKRSGPARAAEKIFDRAASYYEQDDLLDAVRELHRVLANSFTGDTMLRFQRTMFLLSRCYLELHLAYAAKYVALAAAYIALYSDNPGVAATLPTMLFEAANADDGAGNSLSFAQLFRVASECHFALDPDPFQTEKYPHIQVDLQQIASLRRIARRAGAEYESLLDEALASWPDSLREAVVEASNDPAALWMDGTYDEMWESLQESFLGRPFGDVGPVRVVEWRALGIKWSISFSNTYQTVPRAERFVAELQIALVALGHSDLCLLPTEVHIALSLPSKTPQLKSIQSAPPEGIRGAFFSISLSSEIKMPQRGQSPPEILTILGEIIRRCSVLPDEDLFEELTADILIAAERVFIGRPYEELYVEFMPQEIFLEEGRCALPAFGSDRAFNVQEHPALAWVDGPGPTYSTEVARDAIRGRYERGAKCVGITVSRLMKDPIARRGLEHLRKAGSKDWEIISIIANAAVNMRMEIGTGEPTPETIERFRTALEAPEEESTALSAEMFTENTIVAHQRVFHAAFLAAWGLRIASGVVDHPALENFLVRRYGLRSDDEDHPDIFGWAERSSI